MNPYLYLLRLWGRRLPQLVEIKPSPDGNSFAVRVAAADFTWIPAPLPAANDPCPP